MAVSDEDTWGIRSWDTNLIVGRCGGAVSKARGIAKIHSALSASTGGS